MNKYMMGNSGAVTLNMAIPPRPLLTSLPVPPHAQHPPSHSTFP